MAILNFPTNPNPGETYSPPGSVKTYQWNGTAWLIISSPGTGPVTPDLVLNTLHLTATTNVIPQDPTVGTLIVDGGAYVQEDLIVGGFLYINASPVITTASFSGQANDGIDIDIVQDLIDPTLLIFNNTSTFQSVTGRGNSTTNYISFLNATNSTSTNSGAVTVLGGLGVGKRINSESMQIADTVMSSSKINVDDTITYVVDSYLLSQYRSAKYQIQIDEGTTSTARFQSLEIMVIASNTGTAFSTEYGSITSNGSLGTFSKTVTGLSGSESVNLCFTPIDAIRKTVKMLRTAITV